MYRVARLMWDLSEDEAGEKMGKDESLGGAVG